MEVRKKGQPIGRKLQLVLLLPVLIGIIICTIIVISILFVSQNQWLNDTKQYIIDEEKEFMLTYAKSVANTVESILGTQWFYLNFITQVYEKVGNDEIKTSDTIQQPKYINAYDVTGTDYPDTTTSEWLSGKDSEIADYITQLSLPDALIRTVYLSSNISKQLGYILNSDNDDLLYVYPVENMDFINENYNYEDTCAKTNSKFTPTCTEQFSILKNKDMQLVAYYDAGRLFVLNNFADGAGVSLLPEDYLINNLIDSGDYTTFVCHNEGNWTIFVSGSSLEDFTGTNKEISKALYQANNNSRADFKTKVESQFADNLENTIKASIDGSTIYYAYTRANITINGSIENSYVVGISRSESSMLKTWDEFINELLKISIIQACIFGIFLIISFIVAWRLSLIVVHRVVHPLEAITGYLNKNDPPLSNIKNTFNSQINSILDNLRKVEIIEKFIDPVYFNHPLISERLANLHEARQLFIDIDNKRGLSIVNNLIGNLFFNRKDYEEAERYYRDSLQALENLLQDINKQQQDESLLSIREREKLNSKKDNTKDPWVEEKSIIEESISDKQQQVCMALMARLKENHNESTLVKMRTKWKELIKIQTLILQYYENSRKNFVKYLKLLIDMSESYQVLQYYHTASELLDIVYQELWKIDNEKKIDIDIDVNRLRKIGIFIVETEKIIHFRVDGLIFEKDILMQKMLYRRATIALDNDKYHKAAKDFTLALECGKYFDPVVRKDCISNLYNLFKKFGMIGIADELNRMYLDSCKVKKNILVCLAYELKTNSGLSADIIRLFNSIFRSEDCRIGVITKNSKLKSMNLCCRDFPGYDLENLVIHCKNSEDNENLIDTMSRGIEILNDFNDFQVSENILFVFYKKENEIPSVSNLDMLGLKIDKRIRTVFVNFGEIYSKELKILLENNEGEIVECKNRDLSKCEKTIMQLLRI